MRIWKRVFSRLGGGRGRSLRETLLPWKDEAVGGVVVGRVEREGGRCYDIDFLYLDGERRQNRMV